MTKKHGVAGGPHHHADHGEPNIAHALRRVGAISDTQHVAHCHKQGVGILYVPSGILRTHFLKKGEDTKFLSSGTYFRIFPSTFLG